MDIKAQILNAYENIILSQSDRAATLDNIAKEVGVSKGGLLYHYPSKEHLNDALLEKLLDLAARYTHDMVQAPEGVIRYFLRSSIENGTPLDRTLLATVRLGQTSHSKAQITLKKVQLDWLETLENSVSDPELAQLILLIGDGLYYNASLSSGGDNLFSSLLGSRNSIIEKIISMIEKI